MFEEKKYYEKMAYLFHQLKQAEMTLALIEDEDEYEFQIEMVWAIKDEINDLKMYKSYVLDAEEAEKIQDSFFKKEEKEFKEFQRHRWELKELKARPHHYISPYKKAERNKRKKKAAMKRSMSWAVI